MSKPTVEEVLERFPWLEAQLPHGGQVLEDAKVGKFNYEFLGREAGYRNDTLAGVEEVKIFFFTEEGTHLGNAHKGRPWLSFFTKGTWMRNVREALDVLGPESTEVHFAVEVTAGTLTVYTPLKHLPPSNLLAMELNNREEARQRWAKENAAKV